MKYRPLGTSRLTVSEICLGTMTWGRQTTEAEAFRQMDMAVERGVTAIDIGEMYPIPPAPDTIGLSEAIVGRWLKSRGGRDRLVLVGKAVGDVHPKLPFHRGGRARLDRPSIRAYVDEALSRLETDYLDVLLSHWPDRKVNIFGERYYRHQPDRDGTPLEETMEVFGELLREGKVRAAGASNETPWGLMRQMELSRARALPAPTIVQNAYNLINRTLEIGLSEIIKREGLGLMAYSPLAFGVLSGKYLPRTPPDGARMTLYPELTRYMGHQARPAVEAYVGLARTFGIDPSQMAIAFALSRPFVGTVVIGATDCAQLGHDLDAVNVTVSDELEIAIEETALRYPDPCA